MKELVQRDWKSCLKDRRAKEINIDDNLIRSLMKTSKNKRITSNNIPLTNITSNSKYTLLYDSLRETLEALSIKFGYKIYNHECYTAFIRETLKESEIADDFDEIRLIRNKISYDGMELDLEESKVLLTKVESLIYHFLKELN